MIVHDPAARTRVGTQKQREIQGAPANEPGTLLESSWRDYIFAEVWTRPGLDRPARFMVAMAGAAMSAGSQAPLEHYIRGALTTGDYELPELREAALQIGVYSGWSRAVGLDEVLHQVDRS